MTFVNRHNRGPYFSQWCVRSNCTTFWKWRKPWENLWVASRSAQCAIFLCIMWMKFCTLHKCYRYECDSLFYAQYTRHIKVIKAGPSGLAVCGFESCWGHGRLPLEIIVCYHVEVSASGWSLVQRFPTEYGVSVCDREASTTRRPWPITGGCATREGGGGGRRSVTSKWIAEFHSGSWSTYRLNTHPHSMMKVITLLYMEMEGLWLPQNGTTAYKV